MAEIGTGRLTTPLRIPAEPLPRFETPLVPRNSISGRALVAVVAIMTFLASLTTGAAVLVSKAAGGCTAALVMRRPPLREGSAAVLGLVARRETHFAHCVRCARTIATSQSTKRAARAATSPALLGAA